MNLDRIIGIRGFHEFDCASTRRITCKSTSNSKKSKTFNLRLKSEIISPIQRITDWGDYNVGSYLIIELDDLFHLAKIIAVDQNNQITVSFLTPPLPAKRFSLSVSSPTQVSAVNVLAKIRDSPRKTKANTMILSDEVFLSIQTLIEEFQHDL